MSAFRRFKRDMASFGNLHICAFLWPANEQLPKIFSHYVATTIDIAHMCMI